eukprot:98576_1
MLQFTKSTTIPAMSVHNTDPYGSTDSIFTLLINPHIILTKKKYFSAFGAFCINFIIGGYLAVGNFIPYLASYLTASQYKYNINSCTNDIQNAYASNTAICNWLLTAFTVGYALFAAIGGAIQLYTNTRICAIIGGTIVTCTFLFTWYNTNNLYVIILCSFGLFYGIGTGIMWSPSVTCVIRWFPKNKALLTGLLMSALASGSICYSLIETLYINSTNIANNNHCGYTLHSEIIDKVPSTFCLLAAFCAVCTLLGAAFLFDKPAYNSIVDAGTYTKKRSFENEAVKQSEYCDEMNYLFAECNKEYTLKEAVFSTQFWIIFVNVMCNIYVLSFVYSDWKEFAQEYLSIEDDAFLLTLNIVAAMTSLIARFVWGFYYDFVRSYKLTMNTITLMTFIFIMTLPFCKGVNNIMAFIWICALWFCISGTYTVLPAAISDTFGDKYCAILTGFIIISEIIATGLQSGFFSIIQMTNMGVDNR